MVLYFQQSFCGGLEPLFSKSGFKKEIGFSRNDEGATQGTLSLKKPCELLKKLNQNFSKKDGFLLSAKFLWRFGTTFFKKWFQEKSTTYSVVLF